MYADELPLYIYIELQCVVRAIHPKYGAERGSCHRNQNEITDTNHLPYLTMTIMCTMYMSKVIMNRAIQSTSARLALPSCLVKNLWLS